MVEKIYLIRHGLTESNKKKIYAGWCDEDVSEEGLGALIEIGRKLSGYKIEKIFSSPIRRAVQTAEVMKYFLNVPLEVEKNLIEMKMGPWEGLTEYQGKKGYSKEWKIWNSKPSLLKLDGRETLEEVQQRALKSIERISNYSDISNVLAVTHVAIIRILLVYFNKLLMDEYRKIKIPNGAVYLLDCREIKKRIKRVI